MLKMCLWPGLCSGPSWGAYSAPPDRLTGFKGPTSKGGGQGEEGRAAEWKGREGSGAEKGRQKGRGRAYRYFFFLNSSPAYRHLHSPNLALPHC